MTAKTIRVSEDTGQKHRSQKRRNDNFEDVIERCFEENDALVGFGAQVDTTIDESVQEVKEEINEDVEAGR